MSVKLSGYIWRRIGGKIIPIRRGLTVASDSVNKLVNKALSTPVSIKTGDPAKKALLGRGVDFNVFSLDNMVLKLQRLRAGTSSKSILKKYPETANKVALSKAVADNLPNYGIPTLETEVIRVHRKKLGLLQPKVDLDHSFSARNANWLTKSVNDLEESSGLRLDLHANNRSANSEMIDTGLNLKKTGLKRIERSDMAKEIIGIDTNFGTSIKDNMNPKVISEAAALGGYSRSALKRLNKALKSGYKLQETTPNNFELVISGKKK